MQASLIQWVRGAWYVSGKWGCQCLWQVSTCKLHCRHLVFWSKACHLLQLNILLLINSTWPVIGH